MRHGAWTWMSAVALVLGVAAVPGGSPASAESAADAEARRLLRPPALTNPEVRTISPGSTTLRLNPARDYVVRIRPGSVLSRGVVVLGGHNVIMEAGTLQYARPATAAPTWQVRGLYLK